MAPTLRATVVGLLLALAGCRAEPEGSRVYQFKTNDYEVEYDGQQKKTTIGPGLMRMSRQPEDIEISGGTLRVGGRDYGAVARLDKVSVVASKVTVNGQVRTPSTP
jgi:hypothetical protein